MAVPIRISIGCRVMHMDGRVGTVQEIGMPHGPELPRALVSWDEGGKPEWLAFGWLEALPECEGVKS